VRITFQYLYPIRIRLLYLQTLGLYWDSGLFLLRESAAHCDCAYLRLGNILTYLLYVSYFMTYFRLLSLNTVSGVK